MAGRDDRRERLAARLRANLVRRKAGLRTGAAVARGDAAADRRGDAGDPRPPGDPVA